MGRDGRYEAQNRNEDVHESSRRQLSEQASRIDARDRVNYVPDGTDRAAFRSECASMLSGLRTELATASSEMTAANQSAEQGQGPGTPTFNQNFSQSIASYQKAVNDATRQLYETNRDGSVQVDPITGRKRESDVLVRVQHERGLLNRDMDSVAQCAQSGRPLTAQEMKDFGVDTSDPRTAYRELKQQDMQLRDLQRSLGYAEANLGLALMRSSEWLPPQDKANQMAEAQAWLGKAASDDPWMLGQQPGADPLHPGADADPNYVKALGHVMQLAETGGDQSVGQPPQTGAPTDSGAGLGTGASGEQARLVAINGMPAISDGPFLLPTGNVNPLNNPNFEDPRQVYATADANLQHPINDNNKQAYERAIKDADSIDRQALLSSMASLQQTMNNELSSNKELAATWNALQQNGQEMDKLSKFMASTADAFAGAPNSNQQETATVLNQLRSLDTPEKIKQFEAQNQQAVRDFQGVQIKDPTTGRTVTGADFLSAAEQYANDSVKQQTLEQQVARLDPTFASARSSYDNEMSLYHSPEDARAHYLHALVSDRANQADPNNIKRAQQLVVELAHMDRNLLNDSQFMGIAKQLQVPADQMQPLQLPTDQSGQPTDQTGGNSAQRTALSQQQMLSVSNAFAEYNKVINGQVPMNDQALAVFQQAFLDAQGITPQSLQAQKSQLDGALAQSGWNVNSQAEKAFEQAYANNDQAALSQLQQQNPQAFQARMDYQKSLTNLQVLAHAQPIIEGLVGAAYVKNGDQQSAQPYLQYAAQDPVAGQLVPDVGNAVKQVVGDGAPVTPTNPGGQPYNPGGQPYNPGGGQLSRPGDTGAGTGAPTTGGSDAGAGQVAQPGQQSTAGATNFQPVMDSLSQAQQALGQIQNNGQPLPANLAAVFQKAVDTSSQVNPQQVESLKQALFQQNLPNWTKQQEQTYLQDNQAVATAMQQLSPAVQTAVQKLGQNATLDQKVAVIKQMAGNDQTAAAFTTALGNLQQFMSQNPDAAKRDQLQQTLMQYDQLEHSRSIAETLYAVALQSTGNPQDLTKAKALMTDAAKDQGLLSAFPMAAQAEQVLLAGDQSAGNAQQQQQSAADAQLAQAIPGYAQLKQAMAIMQDQSTPATQKMDKADPLFQQAIQGSNKINLDKLDQSLAGLGKQMQPLITQLQTMSPQERAQNPQMVQAYQKLSQQADVLSAMRLEPMRTRLVYALALNQTAYQLEQQAKTDSAHRDALNKQAKDLNQKAVNALQDIGKVDPNYGNDQGSAMMVKGAIDQAQKGELINSSRATAFGYGDLAAEQMNMAVNGPVAAARPLWGSMNLAGAGLNELGKIPVVGIVPQALAAGVDQSAKITPGAALALAYAKQKDPKTANEVVAFNKHELLNQGVGTLANIGSGIGGVTAGEFAVEKGLPMLMEDAAPGWLKLATFAGVGLASTVGLRKGADMAAHATLGTDQLSNAELIAQSGFSFGATWLAKGAAEYKAQAVEGSLTGGATKTSLADAFMPGKSTGGANVLSETLMKNGSALEVNGAPVQVSKLFAEQYATLPENVQGQVADALSSKMAATGGRLSAEQQYNVMKGIVGDARTQALSKGFTFTDPATGETQAFGKTSRLNPARYIGRMRGADYNSALDATAGNVKAPFLLSRTGSSLAFMGTGGAVNVVYSMGTDITKPGGLAKAVENAPLNFATGAVAGLLGGKVAPTVLDWSIAKPIQGVGKAVGWMFDANAPEVGAFTRGTWNPSGWMSLTTRATAGRFVGGFGVGEVAGAATHNPLVNKKYSWGDALKTGTEWGAVTGTAAAGAPYLLKGGYEAWQRTGAPLKNYAQAGVNAGRRFAGGMVQKGFNYVAGPETALGQKVVTPFMNFTGAATDGGSSFMSRVAPYTAAYGAPFALQWADSADGFYGVYKWNEINSMADQLIAQQQKANAQQQPHDAQQQQAQQQQPGDAQQQQAPQQQPSDTQQQQQQQQPQPGQQAANQSGQSNGGSPTIGQMTGG